MQVRRIISSVVFCLYIAAVAYLCFAKPEQLPQVPVLWFGLPADKVGHFLMFIPFPLLGFVVFEGNDMKLRHTVLLLVVLCAIGIGMAVGVEQVQAVLGYRSAETDDLFADALGLGSGVLVTLLYILFRKKR